MRDCVLLLEIWRSAWKFAADKEHEIWGSAVAWELEFLEGNLNSIFKVNMRTSQKFSTLAAFLL